MEKILKEAILKFFGFKRKAQNSKDEADAEEFVNYKSMDRFGYRYSLSLPQQVLLPIFKMKSSYDFEKISQRHCQKLFSLEDCFYSLIERYSHTGLVRSSTTDSEIHVVLIKKFWLDCYVISDSLFSKLNNCFKHKHWVSYKDFSQAIEGINAKNSISLFFRRNRTKESEKQQIEKLLCNHYTVIFCLVQFICKEVDLSSMISILQLSSNLSPLEICLANSADEILTRANKFRREVKPIISFIEFKDLLLRSEYNPYKIN